MAAKHRSLARVAGLNVETLSKLEGHNFRTAEDVLTRSSLDLVELLDISLPAAERVVASVARNVCPKPTTARALLASRIGAHTAVGARGGPAGPSRAATDAPDAGAASASTSAGSGAAAGPAYVRGGAFLRALDSALGGGVPTGSITELVGPAGAGKTQFCLTLAVAAAAPTALGGLNAGVVFVDTEQKFSGARVAEIAANVFPSAYGVLANDTEQTTRAKANALRSLTEKILVLTPSTLSETLQRLSGLEEALIDHAVRLLVVDSVAALARAEFGTGRGQIARRQELLGQIASVLKQQAERLHMAALVTNQVTTRMRADDGADAGAGAATAALGVKWAHCVNTRLVLEGATLTDVATTGGDKHEVFHGATNDLMNDGGGSGGTRRALGEKRRVVKVVKSPRCALCGFEYQVWEGGVRVLGDRKVKVHPSGSAADGAIRGIFAGAAL
jgi:RAD51-like protein 1